MLTSLFRHSLARELAIILAVKFVLIALAAIYLFGPSTRPHLDSMTIAKHLFGSPSEG